MAARQETYESLSHLYDIAFSWDVGEEVNWLLERFGRPMRRLLEPACGSGRMFPAFLQRGVEVVGIELSQTMIQRAHARMAALGLPAPRIHHGDMTCFDVPERFDGALCPINSFGYLRDEPAARSHLGCVARHLAPGGKYLVQVDLMDTSQSIEYAPDDTNRWEVECGAVLVRTTWRPTSFDVRTRLQTELCRFEVLPNHQTGAGDDARVAYQWRLPPELAGPEVLAKLKPGLVAEDRHIVCKWSWRQWQALIAASPFRLAGVYDGDHGRAALPLDERVQDTHLTWHELVAQS
jgi:hypothetical protein